MLHNHYELCYLNIIQILLYCFIIKTYFLKLNNLLTNIATFIRIILYNNINHIFYVLGGNVILNNSGKLYEKIFFFISLKKGRVMK